MRAGPSGAVVLEAQGLAKAWDGVVAVRDVSLTLRAGEMLALIGPNGAGKSTCFDMLTGQTQPDRGEVRILGQPATGLAPERICRLGVARTFQVAATFASMTVAENVQMALLAQAGGLNRFGTSNLLRRAADQYRPEALALLVDLDMAMHGDRPCSGLAYGDIKRVELAMALAHRPWVLLMDEPTAGMSPPERAQLMQFVTERARAHGLAVLFTEHDMETVFAHASRVLVLDRGALIADGPPAVVRADKRVQEVYLGSGLLAEGPA